MSNPKVGGDAIAALVLALVLTAGAALSGSGTVGMLVVPFVLPALIYAMARVPLRYSLMGLMLCAFTLENPNDNPGYGMFQTPFFPVGAVMLTHLNTVVDFRALSFSGMDVMLGCLLVIALFRKLTGSTVDRAGRIKTPKPLVRLASLSLVGMVYVWLLGMARGGDFRMSLWQLDKVMYLPVVFLIAHLALRGPKDHAALAKVVLGAATFKAALALYIAQTVQLPPDPDTGSTSLPYATTHHDSMLFASASVIVVSLLIERAGRWATRLAFVLVPILTLGMLSNNRRMVWVQIALVFLSVYLATPPNPMKRKIRRALYVLLPLFAAYLAIGWDSKAGIFKAAQIVRSVVDPQTDASSMWREMENYDLIYTIRSFRFLGMGYGHAYYQPVPLPAVNYSLEDYCPHNGILGLWAFAGILGYTAMTLLWSAGVYFAMRSYHASKRPTDRAAALVSFGAVLIYMIQCWGDLGLGSWIGVFTVAPAIAVAGKLAVATEAWGAKKGGKKRSSTPPPPAARERRRSQPPVEQPA